MNRKDYVDFWLFLIFVASLTFLIYCMFLWYAEPIFKNFSGTHNNDRSKELAAISCPGYEPLIVDGWGMRDGHITYTQNGIYFITPNTCWLVVSPKIESKEASR